MHERIEAHDASAASAPRGRWSAFVARNGQVLAVLGAAGVLAYIASWAVAGLLWDGYSPVGQAISETFAIGAPTTGRVLVTSALAVSGVLAVGLAWVLHATFPSSGRRRVDLAGPVLATGSGVLTTLVAAAPCTLGCPGWGTTLTDSLHTLIAGAGYACLILAPAAFGVRVRREWPGVALVSVTVTVVATVGFAIHAFGLADDVRGALQRGFNTLADLWYVAAALLALRRLRIDAID